ncbi:Pc13g11490 [Penicillium rubens Wisconsin 54-1255]|uniref:Pc13g11490 protein n=1 Tax=Penicillium rubens (strain ATCC 28089 / DSM 1075 / NRRL 1951 / Wisconsin 54-1255) TaxID=500485 RepID=B6H4V2_PENRW|nr:Pc13g11490 [Penicillium rubens Wisconsin 54-1255]
MSENIPGSSRALEIQVPCVVFLVTTPALVAIRLWSRVRSKSGLGWDDWTILASSIFAVIVMAFMLGACAYGFGQHIANLTAPNKLMTLKMSILLLYLRIFIQRWFRITCYALLVIIAFYMVAAFFASIFQCTPVARAWNKTIPGSCINITTNWYANAGFSIATDIIILTLPMYPLYKSKIVLKRKIALMGVFALGALAVFARTLTYTTIDDIASSVWTMMEENVAITCACLPMMWMPLARLFPSFFSVDHSTDSYGSSATRNSGRRFTSQPRSDWNPVHTQPRSDWNPVHTQPRSDWNPVHTQPDTKPSISMSQISNSQTRPLEDITSQIHPSSQGGEAQYQNATGITKITEYHVSYSKRKIAVEANRSLGMNGQNNSWAPRHTKTDTFILL